MKPSVVIKEEKKISLEISSYPDSSVVFRRSSGPLGLSCDAKSEVDQDIKFMWTKNGRFLDSSSGRVTFESQTNGKSCLSPVTHHIICRICYLNDL